MLSHYRGGRAFRRGPRVVSRHQHEFLEEMPPVTRRQHGMLFEQATQEHPRDISQFTTEELLAIIAERNAAGGENQPEASTTTRTPSAVGASGGVRVSGEVPII